MPPKKSASSAKKKGVAPKAKATGGKKGTATKGTGIKPAMPPKKTARARETKGSEKKGKARRPPSAYIFFSKEERPRVVEESPALSFAEISRELGARWKGLSPSQREPYEEQARRAKSTSGQSQRKTKRGTKKGSTKKGSTKKGSTKKGSTKKGSTKKGSAKKGGSGGSAKRTKGKGKKKGGAKKASTKKKGAAKKGGKRAPSAYILFVKDTRPSVVEEDPSLEFGEIGRRLGEMWRGMSAEEKRPYERKAAQHKAQMARKNS